MAKRSAPSSPVEQAAQEKLKLNHDSAATTANSPLTPPPETVEPVKPQEAITSQEPTDVDIDMTEDAAPEEVAKPQIKGKGKAKAKAIQKKTPGVKSSGKKPPVAEGFEPWTPEITDPEPSKWWGMKPTSKDPPPHPYQPSARESGAATNPPMWEDRGYRIKRGGRFVKYFGPIAPENVDDLPESLDQKTLLVTKLIDMRPTSKHNPAPRLTPVHYVYEHGLPRDWNSLQSIKALNDRRQHRPSHARHAIHTCRARVLGAAL
jgi:hypothetical protein